METNFTSPAEEAEYWKKQAQEFKQNYEYAQEELEEYQTSSRELEAELEAQLEQAEAKVRDTTSQNQRLQMDNEVYREKIESIQNETNRQINSLADDLHAVTNAKEELLNYIRELEQTNDALENSKRQTISTLEDFEARLNLALERNAYLENELEEKDQLQGTIQRLKDETRDLRLEMSVKTVRSPGSITSRDSLSRDSLPRESRDSLREALPGGEATNSNMTNEQLTNGPLPGVLGESLSTYSNSSIANGGGEEWRKSQSPVLSTTSNTTIPHSPSLSSCY